MLAETVDLVEGSLAPWDVELPLLDPVACPAKLHVHCLGQFLLDGIVGDASRHIVAHFDDSRGLWVARFLGAERVPRRDCSGTEML
jgi:hypothetical protein